MGSKQPSAVHGHRSELSRPQHQPDSLMMSMEAQTVELIDHPYDPRGWNARARTLAAMHYPELAVGDAYKADMLCRTHRRLLSEHHNYRLGHRMGFWMIDDTDRAPQETERLEALLADLQAQAHAIEVENLFFFPQWEEGQYYQQAYPWMRKAYFRRDDTLLSDINKEFQVQAADQWQDASCEVRRHAFGEGIAGKDTSECLGVFATRNIRPGEEIVVDKTDTWGCIGPGREGGLPNGALGCTDPLHPHMATDNTSNDLRWIRDRARSNAAEVILRCRFLLRCVEDNISHPLDHTLVARLTPFYRTDRIRNFSLENDIAIPNDALQQFGADIFANHNYDTWVLFTLRARIANNSCSDPIHISIFPLFSLFNHSCEPNLQWSTERAHHTMIVKANKAIAEGEQMFVEYDGYVSDQQLQERRKRLMHWLGGPCQCTRCLREEKWVEEVKDWIDEQSAPWDMEERPEVAGNPW